MAVEPKRGYGMSLRDEFGNNFSRSAFQTIDGEQYIVGRWGRISRLDDGSYDAWFIGPNRSPLSNQKLALIRKSVSLARGLRVLTGEAYAQGKGRAFVLVMAPICGVRKKKRQPTNYRLANRVEARTQ